MQDKEIHYTGSKLVTIHEAKKQIWEAIAFDKCRIMKDKRSEYTWDDIYNQKEELIIVLANSPQSYYLFDYYYTVLMKKFVRINAVVQATESYIGKKIRNFHVLNMEELSDLQKSNCLFMVFDIDNYNYILKLLKQYKIKRICNFFSLEEKKCNIFFRSVWRRKYSKKMYAEIISEHIHKKQYVRTEKNWRCFMKEQKTKHIVLFGTGEASKQFLECYFHRIQIDAAIDNSMNRWGGTIYGINIYSPEYLYQYKPDEVVVLVTPLKYQNIIKQLSQMGYTNYYVFSDIEAKKIKYQIRRPFYYLRNLLQPCIPVILYSIFDCLPMNQKKIVFIRHKGKGFGCHEKYITLKLIEKKVNCEIVWLVNDIFEDFPDGVTKVENTLFNRILQLATAKIWFDDIPKPIETRKRKKQYFINAWHGTGISLKKFGLDDTNMANQDIETLFRKNDKIADVYLAASQTISDIYRRAFCYNGEILITGSPRVDFLMKPDKNQIMEVKRKLGLNADDKFVLYAPTFISDKTSVHSNKFHDLNFMNVCTKLSIRFGGKWKPAIRLHPFDKNVNQIDCESLMNEGIMNVTNYPDVQELLLATDVLITDYSSIMFDMCYALKKVFLFVPDMEEYLSQERELYLNMNCLPFPLCKNTEELENSIENFKEEDYLSSVKYFIEQFNVREDGNASEQVVDLVERFLSR